MDKVEQVAEQIKAQGPERVAYAKGYLDALSDSGKRDKRYNGDKDYKAGYIAGMLDSDIVTGSDRDFMLEATRKATGNQ